MVCWMPVLGRNLEGKRKLKELIHNGNNVSAIGDRERAILLLLLVSDEAERACGGEGRCTGGQKSSWRSTIIRAVLALDVAMNLVGL